MSCLRLRVCLSAVLTGLCAVSALLAQPGSVDAPLLIQRIVIPPERVAKELDRVQQGALILMPLAEFDVRWERVQKTLNARAEKPRLLRAHYRAELIDRSFTSGFGQWTIQHDGGEPAILPIDSLNLAVAKARWDQGGEAILGDLDGKSLRPARRA